MSPVAPCPSSLCATVAGGRGRGLCCRRAAAVERVIGGIGDAYLDEVRDGRALAVLALKADEWKAVFLAGDWVTEEGGSGINPVTRHPPPAARRLSVPRHLSAAVSRAPVPSSPIRQCDAVIGAAPLGTVTSSVGAGYLTS